MLSWYMEKHVINIMISDAAGTKWSKEVADSSKQVKTEYIGGFQYKAGKLLFFPTAEGYVKAVYGDTGNSPAAYRYVYIYKDHLGNKRMSYTLNPVTNKVEVLEENHRYIYRFIKNKKLPDFCLVTRQEFFGR